ncbi:MAG: hypothetical protein HC901_02815 [Bdellovibrionaceae bacterium]|nr:hypothetical protein [Pseudobdellovibrionaceae bacterium]
MPASAPHTEGPDKLIDLRGTAKQPILRGLLTLFGSPLEHILSFEEINRIYRQVRAEYKSDSNFFAACSCVLNLQTSVPDGDLDRIPPRWPPSSSSPTTPFGGLDAIALGHLLSRVRPDLK